MSHSNNLTLVEATSS